jgi:ceramide glucosyltransferase
MILLILSAAAFCLVTFILHLASIIIAAARCRANAGYELPPLDAPPVTLVRPVCGMDNCCEETLRSTFELDYPHYQILFCATKAYDPVLPLLERLIAAHPHVDARILIGDDRISENPKLNNVVKGWRAASFPWIVIADSNVLMPRDYVQRLLSTWRPGTGLVCSPPVGSRPSNLWAELECAFLNSHEARWQYVADSIGLGFAQGKSMLWQREVLERAGGIEALGIELAEDAASTKLVRQMGLRVRLVNRPFEQPLGARRLVEVWSRQLRWARLRRASFKAFFVPEILTGAFFPLVACALAAAWSGFSPIVAVALVATAWYGAEGMMARAAGWHVSARGPLIWMLRDFLLPVLWIQAWLSSTFVWRGNHMHIAPVGTATR